jgi:hypothetical protein
MSLSNSTTPRTSLSLVKEPIASCSSSFTTTSSSTSSSKGKNVWSSIKRHVKEHHDGMNAAYVAYYGGGSSVARKQEVWQDKRFARK